MNSIMLQDLVISSTCNCLNPRTVMVRGSLMQVPCRKCNYCKSVRRLHYMKRVQEIAKGKSFGLFITLTYDNDHLPVVYPCTRDVVALYRGIHSNNFIGFFPVTHSYYSESFIRPVERVVLNQPFLSKSMCQAVLYKKDLQDFMKRIRIHVDRKFSNFSQNDKKIFFFAVGEYGPSSLRPHYHVLLWFNHADILHYVQQDISSSWSHCNGEQIDIQSYDGSTNYLSSYVVATSSLPFLLQERAFRPFHVGSKKYNFTYPSEIPLSITSALFYQQTSYSTIDKCGSCKTVILSSQDFIHTFPQPTGHRSLSSYDKYQLFLRYSRKFDRSQKDSFATLDQRLQFPIFGYTDFKFYKSVLFYTQHPFLMPLFRGGSLVGFQDVKLSAFQFIDLCTKAINALDSASFHNKMQILEDISNNLFHNEFRKELLYGHFFRSHFGLLPSYSSKLEFVKKFGTTFHGLPYSLLYRDGYINSEFINSLSSVSSYNSSICDKEVQDNIKTKKYNSYQNPIAL